MDVKTIGVLGLGIFGSTIAKRLGENDIDVIAVDLKMEDVERIEPYVTQAVQGNMGDLDLLRSIGFENCDAAIIATGSNLEASVLAIMNCRKLNINHIIAKAKNKMYKEIFLEMGATEVIRPEKEMGDKVGRNLMRHHILDVFDLDDQFAVIEFLPPKKWIGKTLQELDLRREYEINIVGVRENLNGKMMVYVDPGMIIQEDNVMIAIGESDKFEHLDYTNQLG